MRTSRKPQKNRDGPADDFAIEVCPEVHQVRRTGDEGNKMLPADGGLSFKREVDETRATTSQGASTNANLNETRR